MGNVFEEFAYSFDSTMIMKYGLIWSAQIVFDNWLVDFVYLRHVYHWTSDSLVCMTWHADLNTHPFTWQFKNMIRISVTQLIHRQPSSTVLNHCSYAYRKMHKLQKRRNKVKNILFRTWKVFWKTIIIQIIRLIFTNCLKSEWHWDNGSKYHKKDFKLA